MVVAPSDHWIEDEMAFIQNLQQCFDFCTHENALMTLGIQPTFPNTGFGYIEYDKTDNNNIKKVFQFIPIINMINNQESDTTLNDSIAEELDEFLPEAEKDENQVNFTLLSIIWDFAILIV